MVVIVIVVCFVFINDKNTDANALQLKTTRNKAVVEWVEFLLVAVRINVYRKDPWGISVGKY